MATIKDVARAARVSVGTVSNYLNEGVPVAERTAHRIRDAINTLGYQVDLNARGLRLGQTQSIGLLVPNISNPYYAEISRAIQHALNGFGYQTLLCDTNGDSDREDAYLSNLVSRRVDGVIMIYSRERDNIGQIAADSPVPMLFVDRGVADTHSVTSDNRLGGMLAARHLAELGHKTFGLLVGEPNVSNVRHRVEGFLEALEMLDLSVPSDNVLEGAQERDFGYAITELMSRRTSPTAVFCTNDIVAIGAWQRLAEMHRQVPDEISLVGFDDIEMSRVLVPSLTTVAQDKEAMGRVAAERIVELVSDRDLPFAPKVIPPRLMIRGTTTQPARCRESLS